MNLLLFIYSLEGGGAERVAVSLANYWSGKGWRVTILTLAPAQCRYYKLHPAVRRISLNLASESRNALVGLWYNARRIWKLRVALKRVRPDVALAMMSTANMLLALAAGSIRNMSIIGSEHIHPPRYAMSQLWELLRRWSYRRLSAVTALTQDTKAWLQTNTLARHVAVIPNGIEWPLPIQPPMVAPHNLVSDRVRVLLAVGRLDPQKGFDWLVDIFSELSVRHPDWVLVILGEGPQRDALERQISTRNMNSRILLPGRVGNVADWYSRADLFVFSSRFEGFGNTLVEALAHGVPAVSFDCDTGPRDILRDGVDGILVPADDVSGLNRALNRLMGDDLLRRSFAERAREARDRFSMERIAGMWEALFAETGCQIPLDDSGSIREIIR
jgi:glycosyltransferase involved in cell wall biosynthesis